MNRAFVGLSVVLLSSPGAPVRAIPPPPPDDVRVVRVLDGTTIVVAPYGDPFQVRLACIRSSQHHQATAGRAAKAALERLLPAGAWVTLAARSQASDGVELAEIIPNGSTVPVNLILLNAGMVMVDRPSLNLCHAERYRQAELSARSKRLGIWGPVQALPKGDSPGAPRLD